MFRLCTDILIYTLIVYDELVITERCDS